jgi:hypothetical protein
MAKTKVKRDIEVVYGNSMTIDIGNYNNVKPFYSAKTVVHDVNGEFNEVAEYDRLKGIVDPLLKRDHAQIKGQPDINVHIKDGVKCVSVSNVLSLGEKFICPVCKVGDGCQHATRGTFVEKIMEHLVKTGEPLKAEYPKLDKAPIEQIDFMKWWEMFGNRVDSKECALQKEVVSLKWRYIGIADYVGKVRVHDDLWVPAVLDWKCGSYKWEQLASYAHALGIEWYVVADLKKCEFKARHIEEQDDFLKFILKRGEFKNKFGI